MSPQSSLKRAHRRYRWAAADTLAPGFWPFCIKDVPPQSSCISSRQITGLSGLSKPTSLVRRAPRLRACICAYHRSYLCPVLFSTPHLVKARLPGRKQSELLSNSSRAGWRIYGRVLARQRSPPGPPRRQPAPSRSLTLLPFESV